MGVLMRFLILSPNISLESLEPCEYSKMNSQIFGSGRSIIFKHWDFEGFWVSWWCFAIVSSYVIHFWNNWNVGSTLNRVSMILVIIRKAMNVKNGVFLRNLDMLIDFFVIILSHMINFWKSLGPREYTEVFPGFWSYVLKCCGHNTKWN